MRKPTMELKIKAAFDNLKLIWKDWKDCFGVGAGMTGAVRSREFVHRQKEQPAASPPPAKRFDTGQENKAQAE